jgi:alpha-mannosidase
MQRGFANLAARFLVSLGCAIIFSTAAGAAPDVPAGIRKLHALTTLPSSGWKYTTEEIAQGERVDLDDHDWPVTRPLAMDQALMTWLRNTIELPEFVEGYRIEGARVDLGLRVWGRSVVYVNGAKVTSFNYDRVVIPLTTSAKAGERFVVAIELGPEVVSGIKLVSADIELTSPPSRPSVNDLVRDLGVAQAFVQGDPEFASRGKGALDSAVGKIDFAALEARDQGPFDASLRAAAQELEPLQSELKRYTVLLTGQSHMDMAWLWPWTETVETVRNTFRTALLLMKRNPEFTYTQSQVAAYAWMEEKYPDLFDEIKQRVKEGRWELVGGMWVEPDLNLPDGESLVRQILVGKRYFQEKFGVDVRVGWNPDTFGYNWQMPQIYKKSGIDYFMTIKILGNDTTKFPHRLFWWQAPDGSQVLTYFPNAGFSDTHGVSMAKTFMDVAPESGTKEIMYIYGVGDHGGGPTQLEIDGAKRLEDSALFPNLKFSPALPFFEDIQRNAKNLKIPVWDDELYYEYHRGVFTTQAQTKRSNRKSEILLTNAEKFSALSQLFGRPYPQEELNESWKKVLFNQFHDILPGSSIPVVYLDAARDYRQVECAVGNILNDSLSQLAAQVNTQGLGIPLVVFNSLNWPRTEVVEAEVGFPGLTRDFTVTDGQGKAVLHQVVGRNDQLRKIKFLFLAQDVPSFGYKTFRVIPGPRPVTAARRQPASSLKVDAQALTLENEFFKVKVGAASGLIESLYDKANTREVFDPSHHGNLLQTFVDKPKGWEAWNLDADFEKVKWDLTTAESVKVVETGPVRGVIRVVKKFQNSRFTQDITLYPGVPRVDCAMQVDWHEKHILLKVAFPVSVSSRTASYEIPFGAIRRPTTRETPAEKAKFEVPALRWADLSDDSYGVSILNESKYGYDTKDNVMRLSLLRSPAWPDPHADEGTQQFTYSIFPHKGGWEQAGTVRRGYELNVPLLVHVDTSHAGALPASKSFVSIDAPSVILAAMKKAEDDDWLVLRLYAAGQNVGKTTLTLPRAAAEAAETDLMERTVAPLTAEGNKIRLQFKPFEIKTVKVRF